MFPYRSLIALCILLIACLAPSAVAAEGDLDAALNEAFASRGLVVVAAPIEPQKLAQRLRETPLLLVAIAPDEATATQWEQAFREAGVYGQATAQPWDAARGLDIAPDSIRTAIIDPTFLNPRNPDIAPDTVAQSIAPGGTLFWKSKDSYDRRAKPRPDGMGDWPMYNGDSANSLHSPDTLVGPARGLQWLAGPTNQQLPFVFVDGGVALTEFHDLEADRKGVRLIARDAFTGLPIWDHFLDEPANRYALLMDDGKIYIHRHHDRGEHGGLTVALDAKTGEPLKIYDQGIDLRVTQEMMQKDRGIYKENLKLAGELQLRLADGVLVQTTDRQVVALDAATGERLWSRDPEGQAAYAYPTIGGGMFFIHEGPDVANNASYTLWPAVVPEHIHALDLKTGKPLWTWTWNDEKHGDRGSVWNMQYEDGRLASAITNRQVVNKQGHTKTIAHGLILDARTGKEIYFGNERAAWPGSTGGGHSHVHMLLRGDRVYTTDGGAVFGAWQVDQPEDFTVVQEAFKEYGMRPIACSMFRSTPNWWIIGPNVYPMDLEGKPFNNRSGRSGCDIGSFPANGMIYLPPNTCACQPYLPASKVYHSREPGTPIPDDQRLQRGPAKPTDAASVGPHDSPEASHDWPQFFQGPARRLWVSHPTPTKLKQVWRVEAEPLSIHPILREQWDVDAIIRGPFTAPTAAEGVVVYAEPHRHAVVALDPATGKTLWRTTVEGRVDLPPSIYQGAVYLGTRDGYAYALNRDTGETIWRFFAAPTHGRIVANGQLESPWPIFGAVPVTDEGVYIIAGRHTSSDGGLWWYLLDPATGEIRNSGRWNEEAVQHRAAMKGSGLPADQQPIQNAAAVVSDHWLQLPGQLFGRDGNQLVRNADWDLAGLDLKALNTPDAVQREDRVLRFGTNSFIGETIQTAGGWRKPRYAGTLARLFAIDPDASGGTSGGRFVSVGGGATTASGRGGGGDSTVHLMHMLDQPVKIGRDDTYARVLWEATDPLFEHRGERRAITALAASDNAVYLGTTVRNYDRKYEDERKAMPHRLRILDLKTGEVLQDLPLPGITVPGGIAIADDRVIVTTEDGSVTAFAAE